MQPDVWGGCQREIQEFKVAKSACRVHRSAMTTFFGEPWIRPLSWTWEWPNRDPVAIKIVT